MSFLAIVAQIHEGGSFAEVEFTAMGSGSLAALSVLEVCIYRTLGKGRLTQKSDPAWSTVRAP